MGNLYHSLFLYVLLFSIVTFVFASGGEIPVLEQGAKDTDKVGLVVHVRIELPHGNEAAVQERVGCWIRIPKANQVGRFFDLHILMYLAVQRIQNDFPTSTWFGVSELNSKEAKGFFKLLW